MWDDDEDDVPIAPPPEKKSKGPDFQMKFFQSQIAQKRNALQAALQKVKPLVKPPVKSGPIPVIDLTHRAKAPAPPVQSKPAPILKQMRINPIAEAMSFLPKAATDESFMMFGEILIQNEYQLALPNDFDKLYKERREEKNRRKAAREIAKRIAKEHKEEEKKRERGAAIAPPQALLEPEPIQEERSSFRAPSTSMPPPAFLPAFGKATSKGLGIAANIMSKYGYKEGQGLGKSEQGMSTALHVERKGKQGGMIIAEQRKEEAPPPMTSAALNTAEAIKNATKVVHLTNMITLDELDDEFEAEVAEEMGKYGQVAAVVVHKLQLPDLPEEQQVRVFVEFTNVAQAIKALVVMNGRFFGGRSVTACFYDLDEYLNKNYTL